jgi:chromosome segregation ATPase
MARLSGLASEHHPEGPGDAPRRKRGRPSNTPSVDTPNNHKRPASPAESAVTYTKRVKRVVLDDSQQLARELDDAAARSSQPADVIAVEETYSEETTRRTRRHSEPLVTRDDDDLPTRSPPPATQPLPGLTPHLDRVGASRGRPTNASRRSRQSMPVQLQLHNVDETNGLNEHQFAPLSAVLDGRMKRRLRRSHLSEEINELEEHKKGDSKMRKDIANLRRELRERDKTLQELNFQLEAIRMGRIDVSDDKVEELEQELEQAQQEIEELRASSVYDASEAHIFDDDDDDDLLIEPADLNITQEQLQVEPHANGFYAKRAIEMSSQMTIDSLSSASQTTYDVLAEASQNDPMSVPDKISDQTVQRFETEFERLTVKLATSEGALRIIALQLQNLHVVRPGASSKDIIDALRHAFEGARETVEKLFPGTTIGLTNAELIGRMVQMIEETMVELSEKVTITEKHNANEQLLRAEVNGLIDLLTSSEAKNKDLEDKFYTLDKTNDKNERELVELQERVVTLDGLVNTQDADIQQRDATIRGLNDELEDKETALQRIRDALNKYREDCDALTATVTRLERHHEDLIAKMEQDHAAVVQDLQQQLEAEMAARDVAEGEALQKTEYIEESEERLGALEKDILDFTNQMTNLQYLLAEETELRQATEQERDEAQQTAYNRQNEIENLKEQIADLEAQLHEFRTNLDAERTQRVQTEATLDEANEKIDELNDQVHTAGLQANELRSKLFEVQQAKELVIAQLKDEAKDREEELQEDLNAEIQRRQTAEQDVATLDAQCNQLQSTLTITENDLEDMARQRDALEADRNEKVAIGNRQRDDLAKKLAALENTSASTITTLQANITDLTNDLAAQRVAVQELKDAAIEANQQYTDTLADRDATIETLETDLTVARDANNELEAENKSLARRVENEAHELLNIMGAHAEEANNLRAAIAAQDAHIAILQQNATKAAVEYTAELTEKVQEIEDMRIMGDNRAEIIVALQNQIEDLKERFRIAENDTRTTMDALTESRRKLQEENEQLAAALIRRNAEALKAIQEMKVKGVEVKTNGAGDLHQVFSGKITKVAEKVKIGKKKGPGIRKSKRQWDSGFGVDEMIEDEGVEDGLMEA